MIAREAWRLLGPTSVQAAAGPPLSLVPPRRPRIVWLAVADGRGHLMRAQLMRGLLAEVGVDVDLVTTSEAGAAFVRSFGAPCRVLSHAFGVQFDGQQNLRKARTSLGFAAYLALPSRCRRDLRWLEDFTRDADLIVNDSFHPALLVAGLADSPMRGRLVQLQGQTLRHAVEHQFGGTGLYAEAIRRALRRSHARVEHSLSREPAPPDVIRLPPLIAMPRRDREQVRADLGVPAHGKLAVLYLNPYFHDTALAAALERPLLDAGFTVHAVGEGFADRPGWVARDPALIDAVAACDVLVSAPGMAALGQVRTFGVPFIALATAQPEQRQNLALLDGQHAVVELGPDLSARLAAALAAIPTGAVRPDPRAAVQHLQTRWVDTLTRLLPQQRKATPMTTHALVLETNNLTGGAADVDGTVASLTRLLGRLRAQTRPLASLHQFVITHDGLPADARARLDRVAGVAIRWVELAAGTDYYAAKNVGFDATDADVVAFADADCWPEPTWLEALLAPFSDERVLISAGRTTYRTDLLGTAASTIDFMYFQDDPATTRNFYANNVAFRRAIFDQHRYAVHDMYRGHCQIMATRLHQAGVPIEFVPAARTIHRFPDQLAELVKLRLLRGEDTCEITPHLVRTYLPAAAPLGNLGPVMPLAVLATRFVFSVRALNHQDMPPARGARWLATVGAIAGISLVDAAATLVRGVRGRRIGSRGADAAKITLSYHGDHDQLSAA